jgi:RND family efflux transporter, MFP subunit
MKKRSKIILGSIIVIFLAGIIFYPHVKKLFSNNVTEKGAATSSNRNQELSVSAMILQYDTLVDVFRTKGLLIPDEEVDLSFEMAGKITKIFFEEGSFVQKGALLAKVNDETLQAELKKLEAQKPLAQERVFRQKALYEKDAVSKETYESVLTELEKLKADIELVKARINQTELKAPFDGMVGLRQVSEGAYASPTTIITKLTKISPLKIEFSVNEKQASDIGSGTKLKFMLDDDRNEYDATVYAVESKLDAKTLSLKVRARYPNPGGKLKPGHSATVEISMKEIVNTIVIPSVSTVAEMGRNIAYIYKDGKAQQVVVQKGMRTASSVQIVEGLQVGDTLLTTGVMQLRDGIPVVLNSIQ